MARRINRRNQQDPYVACYEFARRWSGTFLVRPKIIPLGIIMLPNLSTIVKLSQSGYLTEPINMPYTTHTIRDAATLGRLIRRARKQQSLTLETLAGLCGLSIRFLSELENGRETCSLVRVLWVLDALGIELTAQLPQVDGT